jgi:hypothetical protein
VWKRKRKKEIAWSKVRDKHWDNKAKCEIELYGSKLKQPYGFLADPSKSCRKMLKTTMKAWICVPT